MATKQKERETTENRGSGRDDRSHIIAQAETCPAVGLLGSGLFREYGLSFTGVNEEPYGAFPLQCLILTLSKFFFSSFVK